MYKTVSCGSNLLKLELTDEENFKVYTSTSIKLSRESWQSNRSNRRRISFSAWCIHFRRRQQSSNQKVGELIFVYAIVDCTWLYWPFFHCSRTIDEWENGPRIPRKRGRKCIISQAIIDESRKASEIRDPNKGLGNWQAADTWRCGPPKEKRTRGNKREQ